MDAAAAGTAGRRSLDADLASDLAARERTPAANHHAVELHREAAVWWKRAGDARLAERHETWAKLHAQLAARLTGDEDEDAD